MSVSKADGAKGMERMMTESRTRVFVLAAASLGLTGVTFVRDVLMPPGIPVWLFYPVSVLPLKP